MKRSILGLVISLVVLALGWVIPHSLFSITIEVPQQAAATPTAPVTTIENTPTESTAPTAAATAAVAAAPTQDPVPTAVKPPRDPDGEVYFSLLDPYTQSTRLVRLPGSCVTGRSACPTPVDVPTPFKVDDVVRDLHSDINWTKDGSYAVLAVHPADDLARGRSAEEMKQLEKQSPADFQVSPSTIYLFDTDASAWRAVYTVERKYASTPVWSPDGQWLAFSLRTSPWIFHPRQPDDGIYTVRPDGSDLHQLTQQDAAVIGWIGNSVLIQRTLSANPPVDYAFETISLADEVKPLFKSTRVGYYTLDPNGGTLMVSDGQYDQSGPQKGVDLLALDGSVTHSYGLFSNQTASIFATTWSSDGRQVAFANLRRVYAALRDGDAREIYRLDDRNVEPNVWGLWFSPDQKFLLMDVYDGQSRIMVASLADGQTRELKWAGMNDWDQAGNISWRP